MPGRTTVGVSDRMANQLRQLRRDLRAPSINAVIEGLIRGEADRWRALTQAKEAGEVIVEHQRQIARLALSVASEATWPGGPEALMDLHDRALKTKARAEGMLRDLGTIEENVREVQRLKKLPEGGR